MQWEDLAIPRTIQAENVNDIYAARLRDELTSSAGFSEQAFDAEAQYCVQANTHLEQGLEWAGAGKAMQDALHLPGTTPMEIHQYGRQLMGGKKYDAAMVVFKYNAECNGDERYQTGAGSGAR